MRSNEIKVWDVFIRLFHWCLVVSFITAYVTENNYLDIHIWAGYIVLFLVAIRFFYGFFGSAYARFSNFIYKPTEVVRYAIDVLLFRAQRYMGHNPAGGLMIIFMLVSLALTSITGMAQLAVDEGRGLFLPMTSVLPHQILSMLVESHEPVALATVLLIVTHIAGVLIGSIVHEENLVRSMINGKKRV